MTEMQTLSPSFHTSIII